MKFKQLALMVAVAAALGGAAFILNKKEGTPTGGKGAGAKVIELPLNDISQVTITSPSGALNLVKKDEAWKVQERADYPADFTRVHDLLRKLWDLKTVQEVKAGPSQFARLELAEPLAGAGTKVEFKDKEGKALGALILGKKHMKEGAGGGFGGPGEFPVGRYILPIGTQQVSLVSETLEDVDAKAESWLQRDFLRVENTSAVTLAGATDEQKWKLTRENANAEWKLEGAKPEEKLDSTKAASVGNAFLSPTFADVLNPDAKPADTGLDKPVVVTVETFDGFTYVFKAGKENAGNIPVTVEVSGKFAKERAPGKDEKPEDKKKLDDEFAAKLKGFEEKLAKEKKFEGRPFLIAKTTLDQIIKDRKSLMQDPPAPAAPAAGAPPAAGTPFTLPPGSSVTPPVAAPPLAPASPAPPTASKPERKPVEAVTPPVSVPPVATPPAKPADKPAAPNSVAQPAEAKPTTPPAKPAEKAQ